MRSYNDKNLNKDYNIKLRRTKIIIHIMPLVFVISIMGIIQSENAGIVTLCCFTMLISFFGVPTGWVIIYPEMRKRCTIYNVVSSNNSTEITQLCKITRKRKGAVINRLQRLIGT